MELPEAEVLRRELEREAAGKTIDQVEAQSMAAIANHRTRKDFASSVEGTTVREVTRKGTLVLMGLSNNRTLVVEPGGWWRTYLPPKPARKAAVKKAAAKKAPAKKAPAKAAPAKAAKVALPPAPEVVVRLRRGPALAFDPVGGCGRLSVVPTSALPASALFAGWGYDPIETQVSWSVFADILALRPGPVRRFLMDRSITSGIGPVYADEILYTAGLRHDREVATLSKEDIRRLHRGLVEVLNEAVRLGGMPSHAGLGGEPGQYPLAVWGRAGELSPRGRTPIVTAETDLGTTYFCDTQV